MAGDHTVPVIQVHTPSSGGVPNDTTIPTSSGGYLAPHHGPSDFKQQQALGNLWENSDLPNIDGLLNAETRAFDKTLRKFFNDNAVPAGTSDVIFWPLKLFNHIFRERTVAKLVKDLCQRGILEDPDGTLVKVIMGPGTGSGGYRRVLALLLLAKKEKCLQEFISNSMDDDTLPLSKDNAILDNDEWSPFEKSGFLDTYQWRLMVPYFKSENDDICRMRFLGKDIQPWIKTKSLDKKVPSVLSGAYGSVYRIVLHPWQHEFHGSYSKSSASRNIFALKSLHDAKLENFEREIKMLTRFGKHENIVTLLATITCESDQGITANHLLFPWADMDLLGYWEQLQSPEHDLEHFRWVAEQCYGIIGAVDFIHNPRTLNADNRETFGRHGDIKAENILYFGSDDGKGTLVISDLGLSAEHREISRSNIPGSTVSHGTPNYRPPECDMEYDAATRQGAISRSFDIWTLGCLLLEFTVWTLEGWEGRNKFREDRCASPYFKDKNTDVYFKIESIPGDSDRGVFVLKKEVIECFKQLHEHPQCSQFVHDLLDLVQDKMLCIEHQERIVAMDLKNEFEGIWERCKADDAYCLQSCHWEPKVREPERVDAVLIEEHRN